MKKSITKKQNKADIQPLDVFLLCSAYAIAASFITVALTININELVLSAIALAICAFSVFVFARIAKTFKAIIMYAIILGASAFIGGSLLLIGLFAALALCCCSLTYLLGNSKSPFIWGVPLIPLIVALFISPNANGIIVSLSPLPAAILLSYSVNKKLDRVSAVCRISFGLCVVFVVSALITLYSTMGEISLAAAKSFIDTLKEEITVACIAAMEEIEEMMGLDMSDTDMRTVVDAGVGTVFNLLPGLLITVSNVIAYIIHSIYLTVCYPDPKKSRDELSQMLDFDISLTSAIVYIVAIVAAFVLVTGGSALYGAVAENIVIVLAPGLILVALSGIRAFIAKKGPSCFGTLLYVGVIFLLATFSIYAIIGVALAGAVLIILAYVSDYKKRKNGN
ncbi:MAG: DUF2232 domain-containing protein [Ruminococcaceae bacterium]|nr:DUF2232 domain-containing protein [Oscillospiraceae bacterium]